MDFLRIVKNFGRKSIVVDGDKDSIAIGFAPAQSKIIDPRTRVQVDTTEDKDVLIKIYSSRSNDGYPDRIFRVEYDTGAINEIDRKSI